MQHCTRICSLPRIWGSKVQGASGDDVLQRFHWANRFIDRSEKEFDAYMQWQCPKRMQLGRRPPWDTPDRIGSTCEPWMVRGAITLLHELLLPGTAKALEWSTGSSTAWLLEGRVDSLISIEHDKLWSEGVHQNLTKGLGKKYLQKHWQLKHIPPDAPDYDDSQAEDPAAFATYVSAAFLDDSHLGTFDYVSIDGRARAACFDRALQLLKPHGGVLVLDNSEREKKYGSGMAKVPTHWLRRDFVNSFHLPKFSPQRTTVWVSCLKGSC